MRSFDNGLVYLGNNLVKIGQLKHEPPDQNEFDGMVASAKARLQADSQT
jgi:hypothetical protein